MTRLLREQESGKEVKCFEYLFPDFAESEDERIREALITFFQRFPYDDIERAGTNVKEAIAWLKKQGEQKPAWSEKDDAMLSRMIEGIECLQGHTTNDALTAAYRDKIDWLKSLKDRLKGE